MGRFLDDKEDTNQCKFIEEQKPSLLSRIGSGIKNYAKESGDSLKNNPLGNLADIVPSAIAGSTIDIPDAITGIPSLIQKGALAGYEKITGNEYTPGYKIPEGTNFGDMYKTDTPVGDVARLIGVGGVTSLIKGGTKLGVKALGKAETKVLNKTILTPKIESTIQTIKNLPQNTFNVISDAQNISKTASNRVFNNPEVLKLQKKVKLSSGDIVSEAAINIEKANKLQDASLNKVQNNVGDFVSKLDPETKTGLITNAVQDSKDANYLINNPNALTFADNESMPGYLTKKLFHTISEQKKVVGEEVGKELAKIRNVKTEYDIQPIIDNAFSDLNDKIKSNLFNRDVPNQLNRIVNQINDAYPTKKIIQYNDKTNEISFISGKDTSKLMANPNDIHMLKKAIQDGVYAKKLDAPGEIVGVFKQLSGALNNKLATEFTDYAKANAKFEELAKKTDQIFGKEDMFYKINTTDKKLNEATNIDYTNLNNYKQVENGLFGVSDLKEHKIFNDTVANLKELNQNLANEFAGYAIGKNNIKSIKGEINNLRLSVSPDTKLDSLINGSNAKNPYSSQLHQAMQNYTGSKYFDDIQDNLSALEFDKWTGLLNLASPKGASISPKLTSKLATIKPPTFSPKKTLLRATNKINKSMEDQE